MKMIKKYRKKPVEIEAVQWTGDNLAELRKMDGFNSVYTYFGGRLNIKTLEGLMVASIGDYIIKGLQGEFYPCKPDIFEQTYDKVEDAIDAVIAVDEKLAAQPEQRWIPVSERLPSKEERKEWIDKNLGGIGYLYPCLVTRYSSINPDRTKNNPYVAKHYYDGEDFVNSGEEVCSEYIIAWMPLPEPYKAESEE